MHLLDKKQSVFSHFVSQEIMCVWGVVSEPPLLKEDHGLQHEYDSITEMQVENYYLCLYCESSGFIHVFSTLLRSA